MSCEDIQSVYVNEHFKIAKRKKFKKKIFAIIFVFLLLILLIFTYFNKVASPILFSYAKSKVDNLLTVACNNVVSQNLTSFNYDEMITISYSSENEISSITANSSVINNIGNLVATQTQKEIDKQSILGINIPLGTFTGIPFLIGKGSNVSIPINPIGSVVYKFYTSFTSAGINQTSHKIYLSIESQASLNIPFKMEIVTKQVDILISECLIVGKVPSFYINVTSLDELYK